jgi:hypothetical protein
METILKGIRKRYHERSIEVDETLFKKAQQGDPRAIDLCYQRMENWKMNNPPDSKILVIIPSYLAPDSELPHVNGSLMIGLKAGKGEGINDEEEEEPCFNGEG